MLRRALVFCLLLLCAVPASASEWTWSNGYWWYGGNAYAEKWYQEPYQESYQYWNGYCYVTAYRTAYKWKAYYSKVNVYQPEASFQSNLAAMTALAKARNDTENRIREKAAEVQLLGQAADIFGIRGNFGYRDFGLNPYLSTYNSSMVQAYGLGGQQGSTLYSSSQVKTSTDAYGLKLMDLDAADLTSARLVQGGLDYVDRSSAGRLALVKESGAQQARLAEIRERGQVALNVLKSIDPGVTIRTERTEKTVTPIPNPLPAPDVRGALIPNVPMPPAVDTEALGRYLRLPGVAKCIECHGAEGKNKANFDIIAFFPPKAQSRELQQKVLGYIYNEKGCPKDGTSKLSAAEVLQVLNGE